MLRVLMLGAGLEAHGGVSTMQRLLVRGVPVAVDLRHVPTMVEGSRPKKAAVFVRASATLARTLVTHDAQLVHLHMAVKTSVIRKIMFGRVTSWAGMPTIIHAHGGDFNKWFRRLSHFYQNRIRHLLSTATRVIVLSESWKEFYVAECGVRAAQIDVLPNPVELPSQIPKRSSSSGQPVRFLYLGAMDERKGAFRAFRAYASLTRSDLQRSRLVIAGNGRVGEMRESVRSSGLSEFVTVRDWVGPDERDRLLAESDVYVLPSSDEGLPMGMLEAMSWGLPVLTTPVGGIPEVVEHRRNGLLVNPFDISGIATAYRELIRDAESRQRMGTEARRTVEPFDIGSYWRSLIAVYEHALSEHACESPRRT